MVRKMPMNKMPTSAMGPQVNWLSLKRTSRLPRK